MGKQCAQSGLNSAKLPQHLWHSEDTMKAVKSELAKRLLADPVARVQIRNSTTGQLVGTSRSTAQPTVTVHESSGQVRYARVVVPKAA